MSSSAGSPPSNPPADGGAPTGGGETEEGRVKRIDDRFKEQDAKIEGIGSKLTLILEKLGGAPKDGSGEPTPPPSPPDGGPAGASVAQQVQAELDARDARQREQDAQNADKQWRAGVDTALEKLKPETTPRDPQTGLRGRLQRLTVGRPD